MSDRKGDVIALQPAVINGLLADFLLAVYFAEPTDDAYYFSTLQFELEGAFRTLGLVSVLKVAGFDVPVGSEMTLSAAVPGFDDHKKAATVNAADTNEMLFCGFIFGLLLLTFSSPHDRTGY